MKNMHSTARQAFLYIKKEIQTIFAVSYVLIVAIGMLFTHKKYAKFGINIFDYADVFDFLIAPFSDMRILLFSAITLLLVYLIIRLDIFLKRKYPRIYSKMNFGLEKKEFYKWVQYGTFFFLLIVYLSSFASMYGNLTKKEVLNSSATQIKYMNDEIVEGKIIGKTSEVLFLLNDDIVKVIPFTSTVKEYAIK